MNNVLVIAREKRECIDYVKGGYISKMESILKRMKEYRVPIKDWSNENLDIFLYDIKATSANTIQLYLHLIRECHKSACKHIGKKYVQLEPIQDLSDYVDLEILRSVTLTEQEFNRVREELKYFDYSLSIEGNFRDVAIIDLAWYGLTSKEIKWLRRKDIQQIDGGLSLHLYKVKRNANDVENLTNQLNRVVIIDDLPIVEDIIKAKRELVYYRVRDYKDRDTQVKEIYYVDSPYLIRGINNGNSIEGRPVTHIGMMIFKQLKKVVIPNLDIDLEHLSVEDIRRSMLINLILKENISIYDLQAMLNKKRDGDLQWLKTISGKLRSSALI